MTDNFIHHVLEHRKGLQLRAPKEPSKNQGELLTETRQVAKDRMILRSSIVAIWATIQEGDMRGKVVELINLYYLTNATAMNGPWNRKL